MLGRFQEVVCMNCSAQYLAHRWASARYFHSRTGSPNCQGLRESGQDPWFFVYCKTSQSPAHNKLLVHSTCQSCSLQAHHEHRVIDGNTDIDRGQVTCSWAHGRPAGRSELAAMSCFTWGPMFLIHRLVKVWSSHTPPQATTLWGLDSSTGKSPAKPLRIQ